MVRIIKQFRAEWGREGRDILKDAPVHNQHDDARYPEAHWTGDESVGLVDHKRALIRMQRDLAQMLRRRVPAQENGRERDEGGQYPDIRQHKANGSMCHIQRIFQGTHYRIVSAAMI